MKIDLRMENGLDISLMFYKSGPNILILGSTCFALSISNILNLLDLFILGLVSYFYWNSTLLEIGEQTRLVDW